MVEGLLSLTGGAIAWPTILGAVLLFSIAPQFVMQVAVLLYPKAHARRAELVAELAQVPRLQRPFWVGEVVVAVAFEAIPLRLEELRAAATASPGQVGGAITSPESRAKYLFPRAAAAAMIVFTIGGVSIGASAALPGDPLWGTSQILYSERAESVVAAAQAQAYLQDAAVAIGSSQAALADRSLAAALEALGPVRDADGRSDLIAKHTQLLASLGKIGR